MFEKLMQKVTKPEPAFIREVGTGIIFFVLVGVLIGVFVLFGTSINVQIYDNVKDKISTGNTTLDTDVNATIASAFETQESTSDLSQLLMLGLGMGVIVAVLLGVTMFGGGLGYGGGGGRVSF